MHGKNGSIRTVGDYCRLDSVSVPDLYYLLNIQDCASSLDIWPHIAFIEPSIEVTDDREFVKQLCESTRKISSHVFLNDRKFNVFVPQELSTCKKVFCRVDRVKATRTMVDTRLRNNGRSTSYWR